MKKFHIISEKDNVAVALTALNKGEAIGAVTLKEDIKANFKVALKGIKTGEDIIKYGFSIGKASKDILAGTAVHSHNLKTGLKGNQDYNIDIIGAKEKIIDSDLTFKGYARKSGEVGVRNDIFIIPTVGCVNNLCDKIAEKTIKQTGYEDIYVFKHPYGCSQLGDDHINTQKILSRLAMHPNAGGVLIVSLGCENNHLGEFKGFFDGFDSDRLLFMTAQDSGDELEYGIEQASTLAEKCKADERTDIHISKLKIGLKCGGSDALSGITANPLTGLISDKLVSLGGTSILTEVPEMFGAEHILMERSESDEVYRKTIKMVNSFKDYYISHGEPVGENPSPGNKEGGITTLEEKSLGCIQKGGRAAVSGVIDYGEKADKSGLILLNAPGNDIVAQTVLAAAGAHIILFTTGRGTPIGAAVPTVKISTNTQIYKNKENWIDFNAGVLVEGADSLKVRDELFDLILKVASGEKTKNEINGYRDIAIWKTGVTL